MLVRFSKSFAAVVSLLLAMACSIAWATDTETSKVSDSGDGESRASVILAGGCFWCVETDMEKAPGVVKVISGYSGGRTKNPNYENYASGGHREVVFVLYDPKQVTFAGLVEYLIKHIDPTNRRGQFNDKGLQYSPAVYYENEEEKADAERVIAQIDRLNVYRGRIGVAVEPREAFWPAEEYHQDYHSKNRVKYNFFRAASGRDAFVRSHWGVRAGMLELAGAIPEDARESQTASAENPPAEKPWESFRKPTPLELKRKLSSIQFTVTQEEGTEPAFRNPLWDNKAEGIYVDVVSGEPLFSSQAKFESGTGWPSFVEPIARDAVTYKLDRHLFYTRTEVRSRIGDSHLGHVFNDGPPARGGKRYCMNSAAMRFIPKEKMAEEGYGDYLQLFDGQSTDLGSAIK